MDARDAERTRTRLLLGSLIFFVVWKGSRIRSTPHLESALNDEFVQVARLRAFRAGYLAVMAVQIVPIAFPMPGIAAAQLSILVGVTTSIAAFLIVERVDHPCAEAGRRVPGLGQRSLHGWTRLSRYWAMMFGRPLRSTNF